MKYYAPTKLSENIKETPEGFLLCLDVPIARTGIQIYTKNEISEVEADQNGKIEIYRDESEVFSPITMASFEGKSLTIGHPHEFVNPDNWKDLSKGILQNIRKSSKKDENGNLSLLADILVTHADAIALIKNGLREVSCGYKANYDQTEAGKAKQIDIKGNHLALVREGRAGPSYAIKDHQPKKENKMSKLADKIKNLFHKAADDAIAAAEQFEKVAETTTVTNDDAGKVEVQSNGSTSYDELVKICRDMSDKMSSFMGAKDSEKEPEKKEEKKQESKDEDKEEKKEEMSKDMEVAPSLEERLKAVEDKLSSMMESESTGDDAEEDPEMVGDTASRAEILSPGIRLTKDVKVKAIKASYATKDGKDIIDSLSGGKEPKFDSESQINNLFIAASEIMKSKKGTGLENSKPTKVSDSVQTPSPSKGISPEQLNEINQKFYSQNK